MDVTPAAESPGCPHCGQAFHRPAWGREYLCGSCGEPLSASRPRRRLSSLNYRIPMWIPGVMVGTGILLGVLALGPRINTGGPSRTDRSPSTVPPPAGPTRPPAGLAERLRAKIDYIRQDLKVAPEHPRLRSEITRCYLALALLARDNDPTATARYLDRVAEQLNALRDVAPLDAAMIEAAAADLPQLAWGDPSDLGPRILRLGTYYIRDSLQERPRQSGGAGLFARDTPGASSGVGGGSAVASTSPPMPGPSSGAPGGDPASNTPPSNVPGSAFTGSTSGGRQGGPPFSASASLSVGGSSGDPGSPSLSEQIADTRLKLAESPTDVVVLHALGRLLETQADQRPTHGEEADVRKADLEEALALYRRGVAASRLRVHRAAFHVAAASVLGKLRREPEQRAHLAQAARWAPFHPQVWADLQSIALLTGETNEYYRARRKMVAWRLPTIRLGN